MTFRLSRFCLGLFLSVLVSHSLPAFSQTAKPADAHQSKPASPGVEFTKTQDLKPHARATNRPIKDKWAIVVGINDFQAKQLNNNLGMDKAARDFYAYLTDPHFGRFDKDHVRLLTNEEATRQNILASVGSQWLGQVAGPDDLVVVFIGTHGFAAGDGNTYICTHNTQLDNIFATGISMQSFMQSMKKNVGTDRIVLVLQACYSGAAELQSGAKALSKSYNVDPEKLVLGKGFVILSSSRPDQVTWGDVFSSHLIKALKEKEGMTPLREAFTLAQQRTEYDTTHDVVGVKPQTPVLKADWQGNDLVLGVPPIARVDKVPAGAVNYLAAESHYLLASKEAAQGNLDGAIAEYKATLATDPNYADAYSDFGSALALKGEWGQAAEKFERAIEIAPEDALFHYNYARCLSKLGKAPESTTELEKAYALNPKDRVVLMALSDSAMRSGEVSTAIRFINEALDLYPKAAPLHDRLSYLLTRRGNVEEAMAHAEEAVKIDPNLVSARLNLGSILMLKGQAQPAAEAYRKAIELSPGNADALYLLSSALEAQKDSAGATEALKKFLQLCSPDDPRGVKARKHLSDLSAK